MTPAEVRDAVCALLSRPDVAAEIDAVRHRSPRDEVGISLPYRVLGEHGWLAPAWPVRYGGQGLGPHAGAVVCEELARHGVPDTFRTLSVDIVGQIVLQFGTDVQQSMVLPPIAAGEAGAAVWYTEPEAGSDLTALATKALPVPGGWELHGRKIYNIKSQFARWALCAARTAGDAGDITGITLFLVDVAAAGVRVRPVASMLDEHFDDVELEGVFVPNEQVVGVVHAGWAVIGAALPFERTGLDYAAKNQRWLAAARRTLVAWPSDVLLDRYVDLHGRAAAGRLLAYQVVDALAQDAPPERLDRLSAVAKLWNSQLSGEIARFGLDVHGLAGTLSVWDGQAPDDGLVEAACRESPSFAISAGTSEMMLRIIAAGEPTSTSEQRVDDESRELIRREIDEILDSELGRAAVREHDRGAGTDASTVAVAAHDALWARLTAVGVLHYELPIDERGMAFGLATTTVVAETLGLHGYRGPYFGTLFALDIIAASTNQSAKVGEAADEGVAIAVATRPDTTAAAGVGFPNGDMELDQETRRFSARRHLVPVATECQDVLFVGRGSGGGAMGAMVALTAPTVMLRRRDDLARGDLFDVTATDVLVPSERLYHLDPGGWSRAVLRARLRHGAYLTGLGRGALAAATEHARQRSQFGQAIGRFQSIEFELARHAALLDGAATLLAAAAEIADTGANEEMAASVNQALALITDVTCAAARASLHVFGAKGQREDSAAQRYYRRAMADSALYGTPTQLRHEAGKLFLGEAERGNTHEQS